MIGEIVGTHGVGGELRLRPFNPGSTILGDVEEVFVGARNPRRAGVRRVRPHGRVWLLLLDLADSPEAARELLREPVAVRERDLPRLAEAEYYHYQLVGLAVVDESGAPLGSVTDVITTGANDVLAVAMDEGERLLPMIDEVVRQVDLAARRIVVRVPESLSGG
ncbi:MAG: ribosome maturation factor RimM [Candidatus Binatia bacterium]